MMPHLDVHHLRKGGGSPPFRDPSGYGCIYIEDVDTSVENQIAASQAGDFSLPGHDRNVRFFPQAPQPDQLIVPPDRLFQPFQLVILGATRKLERLIERPGLVGVAAQQETLAEVFPQRLDSLQILGDLQASDLKLDAGQPEGQERLDFAHQTFEIPGAPVVPSDPDHRHLVSKAPEQTPHRLVKSLSQGVPESQVDDRYCLHENGVIDQVKGMNAPVVKGERSSTDHRLPQLFDGQKLHSNDPRR